MRVDSLPHWKWKEIKQQPGTARPGNMLSCCLIYFHFRWGKLSTRTVFLSSFIHLALSHGVTLWRNESGRMPGMSHARNILRKKSHMRRRWKFSTSPLLSFSLYPANLEQHIYFRLAESFRWMMRMMPLLSAPLSLSQSETFSHSSWMATGLRDWFRTH